MEIRKLDTNDYENILVDWWKNWGWTPPQKDFLPEDGAGGFIVYDGDTPVCAGFIYITNSKVCWVDWIISNKKHKENRREAINLLIESLTNLGSLSGCKYAYALIKNNSLIKTYESFGYIKADSYTSEMIKIL